MGTWLFYVLSPLIDTILAHDHYNLPEKKAKLYEKDKRFLIPLYSVWALDFLSYFVMLHDVSIGKIATSNLTFVLCAFSFA